MYDIRYDYNKFLQKVNKQVQLTRAAVLAMDPDFFTKVNTWLIDTQVGVIAANPCMAGSMLDKTLVQRYLERLSTELLGTGISPKVYFTAIDELAEAVRYTAKACFGKDWYLVIYKMTYSSHYYSFRTSLANGPWSLIKHHKEDKWSLFYEDELLYSGSLLDIAEMDYMFNPFQDSLVCVVQGIQTYRIMQSIKCIKRGIIENDFYPLLCRGDLFNGTTYNTLLNNAKYRTHYLISV